MHKFKRVLGLMLVTLLATSAGVWMAGPLTVVGAPPAQATVTPRPTIGPPPPTPVTTPVPRKVDVALIVDKRQAHPGDVLVYEAQVSNVAGQRATNVWLTCDLPEGVEIEAFSTTKGVIHQWGQRLSVEMGDFHAAFESYWVKIQARVRDGVAPGTELIHHANLTSDQAGGAEREAITNYDQEVKTVVLGDGEQAGPTPVTQKEGTGTLPVTGSRSVSLWVVIGFTALIAGAALWGNRGRIRLFH